MTLDNSHVNFLVKRLYSVVLYTSLLHLPQIE